MKGLQHEQLSMFDMFQEAPAPEPVQPIGQPVPVSIQASMKLVDGSGYRVFGIVRAEINLCPWRPSPRDVLEMFPLSLPWYINKGLLDSAGTVDLFAHEVDANGNMIRMLADVHVTVKATDLIDAAKSF